MLGRKTTSSANPRSLIKQWTKITTCQVKSPKIKAMTTMTRESDQPSSHGELRYFDDSAGRPQEPVGCSYCEEQETH